MAKSSFTLLETILSITILGIVISGFFNSTYYENTSSKNFMLLNDLENDFNTKNYENFQTTNKTLELTINKNERKNIQVKMHTYKDENIKVFKYEK